MVPYIELRIIRYLLVIGLVAFNPRTATAEQLRGGPDNARISIMQLSVEVPLSMAETQQSSIVRAFQASTQTITTCKDAVDVAHSFNAGIVYRKSVRPHQLPPALLSQIQSNPIGSATRVFRSKRAIRVLLQCPLNFEIAVDAGHQNI